MAKLCPRGKAAAKRKFKVYPSAYANMYASAVCSGKVTPGGKKKRKKAMGGGSMNTRIGLKHGSYETVPPSKGFSEYITKEKQRKIDAANKKANEAAKEKPDRKQRKMAGPSAGIGNKILKKSDGIEIVIMGADGNANKIGTLSNGKIEFKSKGGRAGYRMGGKCKLAMKGKGRAYGKNS
mgnify:FL=1